MSLFLKLAILPGCAAAINAYMGTPNYYFYAPPFPLH